MLITDMKICVTAYCTALPVEILALSNVLKQGSEYRSWFNWLCY